MRNTSLLAPRFILPLLALLAFGLLLATQPVFAQAVAPTEPTALTATAVGTQTIEVSWTAPGTGAPFTGYKIERSTDNGGTWVVANANTGNDKVYYSDTHSSLRGKTGMYRVSAINAVGTGPVSDTISATPPVAGTQPNAPTGLMAMADGSTTINLSWTAPARGASAITGYVLQYSEKGEQPWTTVASTTTIAGDVKTYTDTTITAGMTRHYRVAATNTTPYPEPVEPITADAGRGPFSDSVSGTTPPTGVPEAPAGLAGVPVGTQTIELSWTAAASTYTILGHRIERSTDNGDTWVVVTEDTGNDKVYYSDTHASLAGADVIYRVAATNVIGMGPFAAIASTGAVTPPVAGSQPNAPTGLRAVATNSTTITLSWTAPARGASAITGYSVQYSSDGEQPWMDTDTQPADTATTITDTVTAGTTQHYRVAATNGVGMGPYSASVSGTTPPAGVPVAPVWPDDNAVVAVGTQTVELTWTASTTTTYTILGHRIERSTDNGDTWVVVTEDTGNDKVYYSDTHASLAGADVIYRVAAINILGRGPFSLSTEAVTPPVAGAQPDAPTGLTVVAAGPTTIILTWTAPARGSSEITAYSVQYSSDGEQPWTAVTEGHSGTAAIYTATGDDAGATRHYRVAASNSVGMGPYSASATVGPADQMGAVSLSTQAPMAGMAITATLTDADGMVSGQMWQWQKSTDKASWMDITGATAMSYTPAAMDEGYYLRATVTYTDKNRSDRMAYSMATDAVTLPADQIGTVSLSQQEPLVGMAITATLTDDDGMISGEEWQWQKSTDKASWMAATETGAMTSSYTPAEMDEGYYLRATVMYTDKYRSGRMAYSMATDMVTVPSDDASLSSLSLMDGDGMDVTLIAGVAAHWNTLGCAEMNDRVDADDEPDDMNSPYCAMYDDLSDEAKAVVDAKYDEDPIEGFMSDIDMYYASVANEVDMVTVSATATHPGATVSGEGAQSLDVGENTITVTVTPEDRMMMMPYTVMVTRDTGDPVGGDLLRRYDADNSGHISLSEVNTAIDDYFNGDLTLDEVNKVIDLYFR